MQQGICNSCPGRKSIKDFSPELLYTCIAGLFFFAICTYIFLTQPAFTKKDADVLKQDLKDLKILQRIRRNSQKVMSRRSFKRYLSRRNSALNDLQLNQAYDVIDRDHSDSISAGELAKYLHEQEEDGDEDEKGVVEAEHDEETSVQVVAELSKKIILSSSEKSKALWDESIELFVVSVATLVDQVKSLKNDLQEKIKKLLSSKMEVIKGDN